MPGVIVRAREHASYPLFYSLLSSTFGPLGILWHEIGERVVVQRILLPQESVAVEQRVHAAYPTAQPGVNPAIVTLGEQLHAFLQGAAVSFSLDSVALDTCSSFQRRVLVAEHAIPRGWISTYGLIANYLGVKGGARAVGAALAHNPFPLIIPCHRAVRSDGQLGGYQGGLAMKRHLLEMEGVQVSETGRVIRPRWYYSPSRAVPEEGK